LFWFELLMFIGRRIMKDFLTSIAAATMAAFFVMAGVAQHDALAESTNMPNFDVVKDWPKPLPNNWIVGQVGGIAVDRNDNIWIIQRSRTLTSDEAGATDAATDYGDGPVNVLGQSRPAGPISGCCLPAPAVMQFDPEGNLLQAWGGPSDPGFLAPGGKCDPAAGCQWPAGEHGIYVDHNDYVYIGGNAGNSDGTIGGVPAPWAANHGSDGMVIKFTKFGDFVMQVGGPGATMADSNDTNGAANGTPQLYRPADMEVDPDTNDLYIADGYGNHRVVVVDADTGMYIKHWGAYGQNPVDDTPSGPYYVDRDNDVIPANFRNPVHCVRIVGPLIYVCDRVNDRIQVFRKRTAGVVCDNSGQARGVCGFVGERFVAAETLSNGSTWDVDTSADEDQTCVYNPDGSNQVIWTLYRQNLKVLGSFGNGGRNAGQFHWVHNLATDSNGNIYTGEVDTGKRAQKFEISGPNGCQRR
jgi:hypothetical protein